MKKNKKEAKHNFKFDKTTMLKSNTSN